jgi:Flp pilus assembly protein TadD
MMFRVLDALVLVLALTGCATAISPAANAEPSAPIPGAARRIDSPTADAYAHYLMAQMHAQAGRFREAVAELRETLRADPRTPALWMQLAQWLSRIDEPDEALAAARKAV